MNLELEIAVRRNRGEIRFEYSLRADELDRSFNSPAFKEDPNAFHERVTAMMEHSHRGLGPAGEYALNSEAERRLRTFGEDLYADLLPRALRQACWRLRKDVTTMRITSEEPWIPWEALVAVDDETKASGDHLAATFALTRWIRGIDPPSRKLEPGLILLIDASASGHGPALTAAPSPNQGVAHLQPGRI